MADQTRKKDFDKTKQAQASEDNLIKRTATETKQTEKEEIEVLISRAKEGNQDAYAQLLSQYDPLLQAIVDAYRVDWMTAQDTEDMKQEAAMVFCKAVRSYDSTQDGVSFGLYAKICMGNAMKSCLRSYRRRSAGKVLSIDDDSVLAAHVSSLADGDDIASGFVQQEAFVLLYRRIREALSPYENRVWWRYVSGATAKEIGTELQKDEKSVSNAIYRIRQKLRLLLADRNK